MNGTIVGQKDDVDEEEDDGGVALYRRRRSRQAQPRSRTHDAEVKFLSVNVPSSRPGYRDSAR